jgi:antitoxin (DNA-binding transcriptional repressor) of toxin-antitoxin stability system
VPTRRRPICPGCPIALQAAKRSGSTRNGRPVAWLVPEPAEETTNIGSGIAQIREFRKGRKFEDDIAIRELIDVASDRGPRARAGR